MQKPIRFIVLLVALLSIFAIQSTGVVNADSTLTRSCHIDLSVARVNASVVVSTNGSVYTTVRSAWSWWSGYAVTVNFHSNGASAWLENGKRSVHLHAWGTVTYGAPSPWGIIPIASQRVSFHCVWNVNGGFSSWRG